MDMGPYMYANLYIMSTNYHQSLDRVARNLCVLESKNRHFWPILTFFEKKLSQCQISIG